MMSGALRKEVGYKIVLFLPDGRKNVFKTLTVQYNQSAGVKAQKLIRR